MTRTELIGILAPPLIKRGYSQREVQNVLESYSTDKFHQQYYAGLRDGSIKTTLVYEHVNPQPPQATSAQDQAQRDVKLAETRRLINDGG